MEITNIFHENGFIMGRMISHSKSFYKDIFPNNNVYFNANIFTLEDGKIWYGDLDLTLDLKELKNIATKLNKKLYILSEMDGRFENKNPTIDNIIKNAVMVIDS